MDTTAMFGSARWVSAADSSVRKGYILRSVISLKDVRQATLRVLGLGFFHCYINGVRVGDDLFLPLNSDFEKRADFPVGECVTAHRTYVPQYDVTSYLKDGDNVVTIHFGGGWYVYDWEGCYGAPKAIFRLFGEDTRGAFEHGSSVGDTVCESFVTDYRFTFWETQDYTHATCGALAGDPSCADFRPVALATPLDTSYEFSDCPADGVSEVLPVRLIARDVPTVAYVKDEDGKGRRIPSVTGYVYDAGERVTADVYDCGKNVSGYPVLTVRGKRGDVVRVTFSEEHTEDGALNEDFTHGQTFVVVCDGTERTVRPALTWYGFRYMSVAGPAAVDAVELIHTKVAVTSTFRSDSELLNWLHDTFVHTQLTNMHTGIPSDCPHLERRGYTGDGQLICHSAMCTLDAERFYRKWIRDIGDCQDTLSGHVQYTAPYTHSGGGPGGWGCAIVEVPYQFYRHYGDASVLAEHYDGMLHYFEYLEAHSEDGLVVSDKAGEWCLGDWCPPVSVVLPAPFVNNYFYIKSLLRMLEIAPIVGREADLPLFEKRIAERRAAIMRCYYNKWDSNFLGCAQGANAFALDIGLGDEQTYQGLVRHYETLDAFDTGIFGTELVTRTLFEGGDGDLAVRLLLSEDRHSFGEMRRLGATTLWEYWPGSLRDRSHNHPMFGAVTATLYDYLLGIRQEEGSAAYASLVIAPVLVGAIGRLSGSRRLPSGEVHVAYERTQGGVDFTVRIPAGQAAVFVYEGKRYPLTEGDNRLRF